MKIFAKTLVAAAAVACCACMVSTAALAEDAGDTYRPNTDGSYCPSMEKSREYVKLPDFEEPDVRVNTRTNAMVNVYDAKGNLVPATLSTDGHFYILPTTTGYYMITTGF